MLENLLFSLNRVMPFFFLIVLGAVFRGRNLLPRKFFELANKFTFKIALPFQLFYNIAQIERGIDGMGFFMLYILVVTLISFAVIWIVTELLYKDKNIIGTLVQGAFRGNFVLLGIPLAVSVMGDSAVKTAAIASLVVIPLYNVLSVIILSVRGSDDSARSPLGILLAIAANPLIIGICCAVPFFIFKIRIPEMIDNTMLYVGQTATSLGLLSIGGLLSVSDATARLKPSMYAVVIKNLLLPAVIMPVSYLAGFRRDELLVLLVLTAAPVAISSYIMASEMGGDAPLASNILILSTFLSGFVLAAGIYILKTFSFI